MGETEKSADEHYYLASGPDDPPKGPLSRSQLSHALLAGQVDPLDRIWVSGLNSWLVAQNVFSEFFESDIGRLTVENRRQLLVRRTAQERRAALEDFAIQFALIVSLVAVLGLIRTPTFLYILLPLSVPLSYWSVIQYWRAGQSIGMERNGLLKFQNSSHNSLSFLDGLLRGMLSFLLVLFLGAEFRWRPRRRVTFSSHIMAAFPLFDESFDSKQQNWNHTPVVAAGANEGSESDVEANAQQTKRAPEFGNPARSNSGTPTQPANPVVGPLPQRPIGKKARNGASRPVPGGTRPRGR